MFVLVMLLGP